MNSLNDLLRSLRSYDFNKGQVIFLKGKFVACASWYSVNAMSVKLIDNMEFDDIPAIGLNVMIMGLTTKTVRNIDNQSIIDFYIEENLGDWKPREFWVEVRHNVNLRYLTNKTNSINQSMRSTTALIMGTLTYQMPVLTFFLECSDFNIYTPV
ncbi:unnamed protein product [Rhizophagus irregularis]|uniref:Uncharacterized protein n=1 Tax=Rhizophagus irregularis TaxID=588596 RepID=A0A915ZYF4_9GLOM|nr:unnamed protein product [Rhizophagus irregularis]